MQNLITMGRIYSIKLENFEGPLDLLCHLIDKNKMDIYDINISEIADQYIDYINQMEKMNLDITSEFLVMSSTLLYLKSKHLLPKVENEEEEITEEELIRRIIEYKKYKELTPTFKKLEEDRKNIYIKSPEKVSEYTDDHEYGVLSSNDLLEAFKKFLERKEKEKPLNTTVTNKEYSVRDRKKSIRNILHNKRKAYLEEFIEEYNRPYLVVTFLGILEMVKEKEVIIKQDKNFDKILVELR